MSDDERIEQLAATLRLLFQTTNDEHIIGRAISLALPGWVAFDSSKYVTVTPTHHMDSDLATRFERLITGERLLNK